MRPEKAILPLEERIILKVSKIFLGWLLIKKKGWGKKALNWLLKSLRE